MAKKNKKSVTLKKGLKKQMNRIFSSIKEYSRWCLNKKEYDHDLAAHVINKLSELYELKEHFIIGKEFNKEIDMFLNKYSIRKEKRLSKTIPIYSKLIDDIIGKATHNITVKEIREEVEKNISRKISQSTIRRAMLKQGYKYKQVNLKHFKQIGIRSDLTTLLFANKLIQHKEKDNLICYLDESCFNCNIKTSKHWIKPESNRTFISPGRIPSISAIGIISENGLHKVSVTNKTFKGKDFENFIKELSVEFQSHNNYKDLYNSKKIVIVLDNSRNHTSRASLKAIGKTNFHFIFQPPYSPFLNAIENLWSLLKRKRRRLTIMSL